jgi:hypothetical protein
MFALLWIISSKLMPQSNEFFVVVVVVDCFHSHRSAHFSPSSTAVLTHLANHFFYRHQVTKNNRRLKLAVFTHIF